MPAWRVSIYIIEKEISVRVLPADSFGESRVFWLQLAVVHLSMVRGAADRHDGLMYFALFSCLEGMSQQGRYRRSVHFESIVMRKLFRDYYEHSRLLPDVFSYWCHKLLLRLGCFRRVQELVDKLKFCGI